MTQTENIGTVLYDVVFVALQPTESRGQFRWRSDASPQEAYEAFTNYLNAVAGPDRFKIQLFEPSNVEDEQQDLPFDEPIEPQSEMTH